FSEELNIGSYETLLTLPVTYMDVVLGKFMAGTAFVATMLLPTLAYPVFISFLGQLDWGPVVGGYIGALLMGSAYAGIGLFASALTRNQIIAFIIGVFICFFLTLIDKMLFFLPANLVGLFGYLGADFHFQNISKGVIDSRDILYFISVGFIALYGANLVMRGKE
ncbi:MAG: ABC transporter permease subunit, partial [Deltaproteobacteria bacterium]|nr:ABC transporter permease subunit [Deltaproteobacteria bacterium]